MALIVVVAGALAAGRPPLASSRASIVARGLGVRLVIGTEKMRLASRPHLGHAADAVAVPIVIRCSKQPQSPQRYSYVATQPSRDATVGGVGTGSLFYAHAPLASRGATDESCGHRDQVA